MDIHDASVSTCQDSAIHEICLIDSENVGMDIVNEILRQHRVETEICYFQSVCSPTLKIIPMTAYDWQTVTVKLFGCECGTNAMDFQILAYIFCRAFKNNKKPEKYIIISRDHGYDPSIKLLRTAGIDVKRIEPSLKHNEQTSTSKKPETDNKKCDATHHVVPTGKLISATPDIDKALQSATSPVGDVTDFIPLHRSHGEDEDLCWGDDNSNSQNQVDKAEDHSNEKTETPTVSPDSLKSTMPSGEELPYENLYNQIVAELRLNKYGMYDPDTEVDDASIILARILAMQNSDSVGTDTSNQKNEGKTNATKTKEKNKKQKIVLTSQEKQIKNALINKKFSDEQATGIARAFGNSKNLNKLAVELPKYTDAASMRRLYDVTTKAQRKKWCTMPS